MKSFKAVPLAIVVGLLLAVLALATGDTFARELPLACPATGHESLTGNSPVYEGMNFQAFEKKEDCNTVSARVAIEKSRDGKGQKGSEGAESAGSDLGEHFISPEGEIN